jgi:amino acid permease
MPYEVDIYCVKAVSMGGPANALLSYIVLGIFIYAMMIILWVNFLLVIFILTSPFIDLSGEMSAMFPVPGAFSTFGTRFVSPGLGFALGKLLPSYYVNNYEITWMTGWNYWLQW